MDDTLKNRSLALCEAMVEAGLKDVVGLDLEKSCSWTSHMLVGTATSRVHLHGAADRVRKQMRELDMDGSGSGKKSDVDTWKIIDGGDIVVSLMESEAREFYALEELWFEAEEFFRESGADAS